METVELIQQSRLAAQIAWDAVKVSNPRQTGQYMRHADVNEGDHEIARRLLQQHLLPGDRPLEYRDQKAYPETVQIARELVEFLQEGMGWGNPQRLSSVQTEPELATAGMLQYQQIVRERNGGDLGERAEQNLQQLLWSFVLRYTGAATDLIARTDRRINPIFEDGSRLSDYTTSAKEDPRLNQLVHSLAHSETPKRPDPEQVALRAAMRSQQERAEAFSERTRNGGQDWGNGPR